MSCSAGATAARDVLQWRVAGPFLRWRHARLALQLTVLLAAIAIVLHGLFGPQIAPANLATVGAWVHYRGLLVLALLAAGNFFCTGCPLVLVRDGARRLRTPRLRWPRRLRNKWAAVVLFAAVLFVYELFDLWALPRATAWLILAYFGAALTIDLLFAGATFCKYLCPIGQFNFTASTLSPLEITARDPAVCAGCRTSDCIKGRTAVHRMKLTTLRGCELGLFVPSKIGNLDCTFCLDCVRACPHDNVALVRRVPGMELVDGRRRSGIGRLARRPDIAVLAVLFTFGAMINAFAMTAPAYRLESWIAGTIGARTEAPVLALIFLAALVLLPLLLLGGAAAVTLRTGARAGASLRSEALRYALALVPLGFGVWMAHYLFHLLTGALTIVPVAQRAATDLLGWPALGGPWWTWTGLQPGAVWPIQLGFVVLGAAGSIAVAHAISEQGGLHPGRATAPWALVIAVMAGVALWVLMQPMEMRAVGFPG